MSDGAFDLSFDVTGPDEVGTWIALCRELPMIIGATDEIDLRERIVKAVNSLGVFLEELGEARGAEFLKESGVQVRPLGTSPDNVRTFRVPMTVRVAAS